MLPFSFKPIFNLPVVATIFKVYNLEIAQNATAEHYNPLLFLQCRLCSITKTTFGNFLLVELCEKGDLTVVMLPVSSLLCTSQCTDDVKAYPTKLKFTRNML